jgi:hypothetical protein
MREMESFVKDYSINQYGKDYNVKLDLTYRYPIRNDSVWRKWIGRLKKHLNSKEIFCDGIVVSEYDNNFNGLHNHLLMYCDTDYYKCESVIFNYWKNIGSLNIEQYDSNLGYSSYIVKHLNKTNNNNWEMLSLL